MKKTALRGLLTLLLCVLCLTFLFACGHKTTPIDADKYVISVEGDEVLVLRCDVDNQSETVYSGAFGEDNLSALLIRLHSDNILKSVSQDGAYGVFFTEIGGLVAEGEYYLYFFTTLDEFKDITDYAVTVPFDGKDFISTSMGAGSLPLTDGAEYIITLVRF